MKTKLIRLIIREILEEKEDLTQLSRTVIKILNTLDKQFGLKVTKRLGEGFNGISFMTNKNHVLKITYSNNDAAQSERLLGKNPVHFCKVYRVFKVNLLAPTYAIEKEFIPSSKKYVATIEQKMENLHAYLYEIYKNTGAVLINFDDLESLIDNAGDVNLESDILVKMRAEKPELFTFFQEILSVNKEKKTLELTNTEFTFSNLGERNGRMCFFDFSSANLDEKPTSPESININ